MATHVANKVWTPFFTFVPLFAMFSINFVGVELENPFGDDDNDLPLNHFQYEMNACLLMLLQEQADLIPGVGNTCQYDFMNLQKSTLKGEDSSLFHVRVSDKDHQHHQHNNRRGSTGTDK